MKKIALGLLAAVSIGFALEAHAGFFTWRYREHATDCTALTDGKNTDLCYEIDSDRLFKCEPTSGDCDTSGEWKSQSTPVGGSDTQVQYNSSGAFAGDADLTFDGTTLTSAGIALSGGGDISFPTGSVITDGTYTSIDPFNRQLLGESGTAIMYWADNTISMAAFKDFYMWGSNLRMYSGTGTSGGILYMDGGNINDAGTINAGDVQIGGGFIQLNSDGSSYFTNNFRLNPGRMNFGDSSDTKAYIESSDGSASFVDDAFIFSTTGATFTASTIINGPTTLTVPTSTLIPLTVKGASSQTADLTQWLDDSNTVLAEIASNGVGSFSTGLSNTEIIGDGAYVTPGVSAGNYCTILGAGSSVVSSSYGAYNSTVVGAGTTAGHRATAIGASLSVPDFSVAVGREITYSGGNGTLVGSDHSSTTGQNTIFGATNSGSGYDNVLLGSSLTASGSRINMLGANYTISQDYVTAFGFGNAANNAPTLRAIGTSDTTARPTLDITSSWATATDASRKARVAFSVYDTSAREFLRADTNGSGATLTIGNDSSYVGTVVNEAGADADFRIESDTNANMFVVDAGLNVVQIAKADIDDGTIDGTRIGSSSATDATFTALTVSVGSVSTSSGGTGSRGGFSLYSPIFAGTTSTGAFQSGSLGLSGHVLTSNGAGVLPTFKAASGGGGTPGGSNTQVQFNDSGSFGGDAGMVYNKTTDALTVAGDITAVSDVVLKNESGYWTGIGVGDTTITEGKVVVKQANGNYPAIYAQNTGSGSWAVTGLSVNTGFAQDAIGYLGGLSPGSNWTGVYGTAYYYVAGRFSVLSGGIGTSLWAEDGDIRFDTVSVDNFLWLDDTGNYMTIGSNTDLGGLFGIDGRANEVQLTVQGNATQTASIFTVENSGGTDQFTVTTSAITASNTLLAPALKFSTTYTVGTLPAAGAIGANAAVLVTDALTVADCATGGGSTRNICVSTGSAWVDV